MLLKHLLVDFFLNFVSKFEFIVFIVRLFVFYFQVDYWAEIRIIDVNDNTPLFSKMKYEALIPEDANIDDIVAQVSATDLDSGLGGVVTYSIEDVSNHIHLS